MKGDFTLFLLKCLQEGAVATKEILDAIDYYGYHESYRRLRGLSSRLSYEEWRPFENLIRSIKERQRLSKLLYKLKNEGLTEKKEIREKSIWQLTKRGEAKIRDLEEKRQKLNIYQPQILNELKIIIFDIPEKRREDRNWLRNILGRLGFQRLQKSVWMGKMAVPEEFFEELKQRKLLAFVEILAVTKSGTIKQL